VAEACRELEIGNEIEVKVGQFDYSKAFGIYLVVVIMMPFGRVAKCGIGKRGGRIMD
jgi:hypothetical protein